MASNATNELILTLIENETDLEKKEKLKSILNSLESETPKTPASQKRETRKNLGQLIGDIFIKAAPAIISKILDHFL